MELQASQQAKANEEQINAVIENDAERERLLEANTIQLNERLLEIDKQFADEQIQQQQQTDADLLAEKEKALTQEIALQKSQLEAVQQAELLRLQQSGATEQQITETQAEQEKQRQILALESERKKLEFAYADYGL